MMAIEDTGATAALDLLIDVDDLDDAFGPQVEDDGSRLHRLQARLPGPGAPPPGNPLRGRRAARAGKAPPCPMKLTAPRPSTTVQRITFTTPPPPCLRKACLPPGR